jgi:orotidine-5'-phosphate decarboxylase
MGTPFRERLLMRIRETGSLLCAGIDPVAASLPEGLTGVAGLGVFVSRLVAALKPHVAAFKPNLAFFEAFGAEGRRVLGSLPALAAPVPVILDAKLADIGNTSARYAEAFLGEGGFDGITVNPYLGSDSVGPFLEYRDKGIFLLCLTSNPGSADLQQQPMADGRPLFLHTAALIRKWSLQYGNAGAVAGATKAGELTRIRELLPGEVLLIPGVGAQGGDLETVLRLAVGETLRPALINASRSLIYASSGPDFAEAAAAEAVRMVQAMRSVLPGLAGGY